MTEQPIDCQRALRMLAAYLDGELGQVDHGDVRRHLDTCRSCYSRMEFEQQLKERLGELGHRVPEPAFTERIREVVRQFTQANPGPPAP